MSRFTSAIHRAAMMEPNRNLLMFANLDFAAGPVRLVTSDQDMEFNGDIYTAGGELVDLGDFSENIHLVPTGMTLSVSGANATMVSYLRTQKYHNRDASIYLATANQNWELNDTPEMWFEGRMDTMSMYCDHGLAGIKLNLEHRLIIWNKASNWNNTQEHQTFLMGSGDNFFDQVSVLVGRKLKWGDGTVGWDRTPNPFDPGGVPGG